jgi:hypothetical protein
MAKGELVDMEKAKDAVKEEVKKRVKREVTGIGIESTGKRYFKAQVNAESGKVVGFKWGD